MLKIAGHYLLIGHRIISLNFYYTNFEKGSKTGKSKRVLKASFVILFEKIHVSASQNNLNFVVGASQCVIGISIIYA